MFNWFKPKPKPPTKPPTKPVAKSPSRSPELAKTATSTQPAPPTGDALIASEVAAARELCITRAASATAVMRMWLHEESDSPPDQTRSGAKLH
jgi:hypothetical protein